MQISVERLGDILNAPPETRQLAYAALPPARGAIRVLNVDFRYRIDQPEVLRGISLDIPEGQVLGVVGPSGSGKSTLTKLIQRLYRPDQGQIFSTASTSPSATQLAQASDRRSAPGEHAFQPHRPRKYRARRSRHAPPACDAAARLAGADDSSRACRLAMTP